MTSHELTLRNHTASELPELRDRLLGVYAVAHHDRISKPWFRPPRFWHQVTEVYATAHDFAVTTGWLGNTMIGYAMANQNPDADRTWPAIHRALPDLRPVGAICAFLEFAVHPECQRQGYGRRIHDALLATRAERVAHLLVLLDNTPARTAYLRWGWLPVDTLRPVPTAPPYAEAMALRMVDRVPR